MVLQWTQPGRLERACESQELVKRDQDNIPVFSINSPSIFLEKAVVPQLVKPLKFVKYFIKAGVPCSCP